MYLAHDDVLNIDVAIKVLPASLAELGAARLQREAIALAKLNHPNIARVIDFAQTKDGSPYMVMEYLRGDSLDQIIKQQKVLDLTTALAIFSQICRGLEFAHSTGVIHRDLKPSNIIVSDSQEKGLEVKILDFGIAKVTTENQKLTSTGVLVGSPLYMSPEHSEGMADKPTSDIYSLGCLMFECLTGVPPLKGANALETISFHRNVAPPLISDLAPEKNYPKEIVSLIDECLAKSPKKRPQSAKDVEERLNQSPQKAETQTTPEKSKPKINQSMLALGAISLLIISMLATGIYAVITQPRTHRNDAKSAPLSKDEKFLPDKSPDTQARFEKADMKESGKTRINCATDLKDEEIKNLKYANELCFNGNTIFTGKGLSYATHLPIVNIQFDKGAVEDQYCDIFSKFKKLETLRIDSPKLSDEGLKNLSAQKSFTSLDLKSDKITDKGLSYLGTLPNLKILSLSSCNITASGVQHLAKLKKLHTLKLIKVDFDQQMAQEVVKLMHLDHLAIGRPKAVHADAIASLSQANIYQLTLENQKTESATYKSIFRCPKITYLELNNCQIPDDAFTSIVDNPKFASICIYNISKISDRMITDLRKSKMERLNFKNCPITNSQALMLVPINTLKSLTFENCNVTEEGEEEFKRIFKQYFHKDIEISCL